MATLTLEDIYAKLNEAEEIFFISRETKTAAVIDFHSVNRRIFRIVSEDPSLLFEEVPIDYDKISTRIAAAVSPESLIREALRLTSPEVLLEIQERLESPNAKVEERPGECFEIRIGGKRGAPLRWVVLE